jgi:ankyrin repeat protein
MKMFYKLLFLLFTILFLKPLIFADTVCIKGVCKKVFNDSTCTYKDKLCCVNEALCNNKLHINDKEMLICLQIILHTFITPKTPIDPNVILYRTPNETILHWAAKFDEIQLMKMLIAEGAKINTRNQWKETPLHYAAQWNSPKAAQLLIDAGADQNAQDQYKKTPFECAKDYKNKEVLVILNKQK